MKTDHPYTDPYYVRPGYWLPMWQRPHYLEPIQPSSTIIISEEALRKIVAEELEKLIKK